MENMQNGTYTHQPFRGQGVAIGWWKDTVKLEKLKKKDTIKMWLTIFFIFDIKIMKNYEFW